MSKSASMLSQRSQSVSSLCLLTRVGLGEAAGGVGGQPGQGPALVEAELERAALVAPALVVIGGGDVRDDRLQAGRAGEGRLPLGQADVRAAEHADPAVGPGLLADPLAGVVAVVLLIGEGVEAALGLPPAADVLADEDVALAGGAESEAGGGRLVVGGAGEDDRIPARACLACRCRRTASCRPASGLRRRDRPRPSTGKARTSPPAAGMRLSVAR